MSYVYAPQQPVHQPQARLRPRHQVQDLPQLGRRQGGQGGGNIQRWTIGKFADCVQGVLVCSLTWVWLILIWG